MVCQFHFRSVASKYWFCHHHRFSIYECLSLGVSPLPVCSMLGQLSRRLCEFREIWEKLHKVLYESQESLQFIYIAGSVMCCRHRTFSGSGRRTVTTCLRNLMLDRLFFLLSLIPNCSYLYSRGVSLSSCCCVAHILVSPHPVTTMSSATHVTPSSQEPDEAFVGRFPQRC